MTIKAVKTPVFSSGMDLNRFIIKHTRSLLKENVILAVTSKIVSLAEGRVRSKKNTCKKQLIQKECDHDLGEGLYGCHLTIAHNLLIPSAGVDESNSKTGGYILYPKNPYHSVKHIRKNLCEKTGLKNLGVMITDSRTFPLRRGVIGAALAYSGFRAVINCVGKKDLFGSVLRVTKINAADALAAAAVLLMGEGAQSCPLAVITRPGVVFTHKDNTSELNIPPQEDLYAPLYQHLLSAR